MKILTRIGLMLAVLAAWAFAGDQYLVRTPSSKIGAVAARHGLTVLRGLDGAAGNLFLVELPAGKGIGEVAADASVQNVEPNGTLFLPEIAPGVPLQASAQIPGLGAPTAVGFYGIQALGAYVNQPAGSVVALAAARGFATGTGAVVAILDTGVDTGSSVLKNSLVTGWDFTRSIPGGSEMADLNQSTTAILDQSTTAILDQSTTAILDKTGVLVLNQSTTAILDQSTTAILDKSKLPAAFGHGTMVAGIVHLVAPTAKIMPVKVFSGGGSTTMDLIVQGINYAVDKGADVINMSFSTTQPDSELQAAINNATKKGVICVASVGNDGKQMIVYPAGYNVIGVASTNDQFQRSSFSNYGSSVDVAAPGEGVITLYPGNNYAAGWGTSFSAPFAAGGAALLVQLSSNTNQTAATQALDQAFPIGQQLGAGELNLLLACLYGAMHSH